ncbi:MAG: hypothetical protein AAF557_23075 [Pseudomonadota bacterium]
MAGDLANSAWDSLPEFTLTSDVEVPVYVIHHEPEAEDYEILCDFEGFMTANQKSFLARPVLRVWAGRQDFERHIFARRLREDFTAQFEILRMALRAERDEKNWKLPGIGDVLLWGLSLGSEVVGSIILWLAMEPGQKAIGRITSIFRRSAFDRSVQDGSAEQQLETLIKEKKGVIDEALARIEIALHRALYAYAWRGQRPGPMTGIDREAWPLPSFVTDQMEA